MIQQVKPTEYGVILDGCQIRIGGIGEKFVPNINAGKWHNEAWLNINHPDVVGLNKPTFDGKEIALEIGNLIHRYRIKNGKLEYAINILHKPGSNIISLDLLFSKGLSFWYQPPLTAEEIDDGHVRPENVEGSYAVYFNKKNNQYKTGKFCHIYRPKLIDANGKESWATITLQNNQLIILMDNKFLDTARYPIVLDPEIGYSTAGDSSYGSSTVKRGWMDTTDGSGGVTQTYHVAIAAVDGADPGIKLGIYETTDIYGPSPDWSPRNQDLIEQVVGDIIVSDDNEIAAPGGNLAADTYYCLPQIVESSNTKVK